MTNGEYLANKVDECKANALTFKDDENLSTFWKNAEKGFTEKMLSMDLNELMEEKE